MKNTVSVKFTKGEKNILDIRSGWPKEARI